MNKSFCQAPAQKFLRPPAAAEYLGLSTSTLNSWRVHGGGPEFVRLGARLVAYEIESLDKWARARGARSTSERRAA